jgi:multidrug resistance efflux pump
MNARTVQQSAVSNFFVAPRTPLARVSYLSNLRVTSDIVETDINQIKFGQAVDVNVAAFPHTTLTGGVQNIGLATANTFSMLRTWYKTSNYTVTISIEEYKGRNGSRNECNSSDLFVGETQWNK